MVIDNPDVVFSELNPRKIDFSVTNASTVPPKFHLYGCEYSCVNEFIFSRFFPDFSRSFNRSNSYIEYVSFFQDNDDWNLFDTLPNPWCRNKLEIQKQYCFTY